MSWKDPFSHTEGIFLDSSPHGVHSRAALYLYLFIAGL